MDHHGSHFVGLTGVELLVVPGLGDVVLPQGDGQVLDVLVLDAVAGRDDVLMIHQNSTALKIFHLNSPSRSDLTVSSTLAFPILMRACHGKVPKPASVPSMTLLLELGRIPHLGSFSTLGSDL